jgi:peptidoglycan/LPS O-acetylase OafA/YrhL
VTSTPSDRLSAAVALAGLLAACALFLGALELFYRPFRLAPVAALLALIAAVMGREQQQRLAELAIVVIGICFIAGAAFAVLTKHPLF